MSEPVYNLELTRQTSDRFFVLTGCSGSGKSTLIDALAAKGLAVYPEPGRQIVREQLAIGGDALPVENPLRFVELVVSRAISQRVAAASRRRIAVFDRGLIDSLAYLVLKGIPVPVWLENAVNQFRHNTLVFMLPPWPEIFRQDAERRHTFDEAEAEYRVLQAAYRRFGHQLLVLDRGPVEARALRIASTVKSLFPQG